MRSTEARFVLSLLSLAALTLSAAACSAVFGRTDAGRPILDVIALPSESFEVTYDLTESGTSGAFVWRQGGGMRRFDATLDGFDTPNAGAFEIVHQYQPDSNLPVSIYDCTWTRTGDFGADVDCSKPIYGAVRIVGEIEAVMLDGRLRNESGSRGIAGHEARCYEFQSRRFNREGEICFDREMRVPLAIRIDERSTGASSSIQATSWMESDGILLPPTIPPLVPDSEDVPNRPLGDLYLPDSFVFEPAG